MKKEGVILNYNMRKEKILELLSEHEFLKKEQLNDVLGVSTSTLQRDILCMEQDGLLEKMWGGVKRNNNAELYKRKIDQKSITNSMYAIGEIAASKVRDGELIFLGSGKTTLAMAEQISADDITVITNGIPQLEVLSKRNIKVFLLCGFFKEFSHSVVGRQTTKMLASYRFDKAFLGTRGFDGNLCPLSADEYEYDIKKICIENAGETYILADHEKFNRTAMYVMDLEKTKYLNYITDRYPVGHDHFVQEKKGYIWIKNGK